jgi:hypothetical protein
MKESPVKIDALLEPLLNASQEEADPLLLQLISVHAEPVIKGVIRLKLRLSSYRATQQAEADDIYQEVVLQLLAQFQRFRKLPDAHPIADVRGIAAVLGVLRSSPQQVSLRCANWLLHWRLASTI